MQNFFKAVDKYADTIAFQVAPIVVGLILAYGVIKLLVMLGYV